MTLFIFINYKKGFTHLIIVFMQTHIFQEHIYWLIKVQLLGDNLEMEGYFNRLSMVSQQSKT